MTLPPVTLDAGALASLRELDPSGTSGVVVRVLATFDTVLTRMLGQLDEQLARPAGCDPDAVFRVAHTLKPSSTSIGALALARVCAEVEHGVRTGTLADLDPEVRRLVAEGQAALAAVKAMLQQQSPSA